MIINCELKRTIWVSQTIMDEMDLEIGGHGPKDTKLKNIW